MKQWIDEFKQMGVDTSCIRVICLKTAYTTHADVDLLIVDEIHRALSEKYSEVFDTVTYKWILGLTATLPEKDTQLTILSKYCSVVFERSIEHVKDDILSPFMIYNLKVGWDAKQQFRYKLFDGKFMHASKELSKIRYSSETYKKKYKSIFDMAQDLSKSTQLGVEEIIQSKAFWTGMTMRKNAVYANEKKIEVTKQILAAAPKERK